MRALALGGALLVGAGCSAALSLTDWSPSARIPVYVYAASTADEEAAARLEQALGAVREQLEGREDWFNLVESRSEATVVLRLIRYVDDLREPLLQRGPTATRGAIAGEAGFHLIDGLAVIGETRETITGIDRRINERDRLEFAASQIADELEIFCRQYRDQLPAGS